MKSSSSYPDSYYDCELVTAARWHDSIGDIALEQVTLEQLASRGLSVMPADKPSNKAPAVIGPGAILTGERQGIWWNALKDYHASGCHILNSVSVASEGDFSYLKDYLYVSVRDYLSWDKVSPFCDAVVMPCPTVLMEAPDIEQYRGYPNAHHLDEACRGEFCILDRGLANIKTDIPSVNVNTRPWMGEAKGVEFFHRNPRVLAAYVSAASFVFCSTLHLSIIACAVGTPFVYYETGSHGKGWNYWGRAEFYDCMVSSHEELTLKKVESLSGKFSAVRASEKGLAETHIGNIFRAIVHGNRRNECCP